jgi:Putative MetA-pathway of phenol degradation
MYRWARTLLLLLCSCGSTRVLAQLPFYTDDPAVTDRGTLHFEFFNEFDALQSSQYPNLRQNTANFKLNYGLPYHLELDVDAPYLSIFRALAVPNSAGAGDLDMGVKWNFRGISPGSHTPALGASLYIEFPTGDERQELGSGLADYWLNFITQVPFSEKTRITTNLGFLFAGNTSTGVIGIETRRGHVFTGGISLLHDFTARLTLGCEAYGGIADTTGLDRSQLQALVGGMYEIKSDFSLTFAVLGGKYEASPRIGGQVGFAVDFPAVFHRSALNETSPGNSGIDPSAKSTSSQRRSP